MSRILKVLVALLAIAAIAAPVMAEDRLSLGGEMRVRGWYADEGGDKTDTWADQRLRIGGKISVAEGVSVTFRTDITEHTWGKGGNEFGSGRIGIQQWDRAHLDLNFGSFSLRAGTQYVGLGLNQTGNSQDAGVSFKVKGPVTVGGFVVLDDNDDTSGLSDTSDSFFMGLTVGHKTDAYAGNVFIARQNEALDHDEEVYMVGADVSLDLGAAAVLAELNYFTGDASDMVDAMGLQLFLDASLAASETMTFGGQIYYAQAADTDGSEMQYQFVGNDFNGWDPINDVGTSLSNEQITYGRPFDFTGDNAGVLGGRLYANFKAGDAVDFGVSAAYLTPEDDDIVLTDVDSATAFTAGIKYAVMANTSLQGQLQFLDVDAPGAEEATLAGVGLFVKF